jgi:hypothetical protein
MPNIAPCGFITPSTAEFSGPMKAVLEASYCWGHRQDQQEERRETHGQKCGADFLDQAGGIERESYAEWLGLGQPFHNLYI